LGDTTSPAKAASAVEAPTADAHLVVSLRPDPKVELDVKVPPGQAVTLVTAVCQVVAVALLGVIAPVATVSTAVVGDFPAGWTTVLVLIEAVLAFAAFAMMRRR
jgi:hypothetical protein